VIINQGSSSGESKFPTLNEVIYWIKALRGQEINTLFTVDFGWHLYCMKQWMYHFVWDLCDLYSLIWEMWTESRNMSRMYLYMHSFRTDVDLSYCFIISVQRYSEVGRRHSSCEGSCESKVSISGKLPAVWPVSLYPSETVWPVYLYPNDVY
jgi:hypothetical protein